MTTVVLAYKRIQEFQFPVSLRRVHAWFLETNDAGILSYVLFAASAAGVILYIVLMFMNFNLGVHARTDAKTVKNLEESVAEATYRTHAAESHLADGTTGTIASMEKISNIKYLTSDRFATSYAFPPQTRQ